MRDPSPKTPAVAHRRVAIGGGVSEERDERGRATGRFWLRTVRNKRRTWNLLKATNRRAARDEAAARNYAPQGDTFDAVAEQYLRSGCPTRKRKWKPAGDLAQKEEAAHVAKLLGYYGGKTITEANSLAEIQKYFSWRMHGIAPEHQPTRQADKEIQTLSNILNYAVGITRQLSINYIYSNRPTLHVVRSPSMMRKPETADIAHQIAELFFERVRSEVFGWLTYFHLFTGCRHSELRRLRLDAPPGGAGYIERKPPSGVPEHKPIATKEGYLHLGQRSKGGINPRCVLWPEFREMIECFQFWHRTRFPDSPWYFPGLSGVVVVDKCSFNHALRRACATLPGRPHITPHGFRSYFTTKLVRDGFRYEEVLEMIGDTSLEVLRGGYSDLMDGPRLDWLPSEGLPGWLRWQPESKKVVRLQKGL